MILIEVFQTLCRIFLLFVETIFKVGLVFIESVLLWAIICEVIHDDK